MRLRIDIGIDAQADGRLVPMAPAISFKASNSCSDSTLNIKMPDLSAYSISSFFLLSRKDNLFWIGAGFERAEQLTAGDDVESAFFGKGP